MLAVWGWEEHFSLYRVEDVDSWLVPRLWASLRPGLGRRVLVL